MIWYVALLVALFFAYLLGSVRFSLQRTKAARSGDVHKSGQRAQVQADLGQAKA